MNNLTWGVLAAVVLGIVWQWRAAGKLIAAEKALDAKGDWVGEVWLEWEICKGSTMYRARFSSDARATQGVRAAARTLDSVLPKKYRCEYSNGRPYYEVYGFGIMYGVRQLTAQERERGVHNFFTSTMPGHRGHEGEHAMSHPLEVARELSGSLAGYKL